MKRAHKAKMKNGVQPVLLVILDGFGLKKPGKFNAITSADTPTIDRFFKSKQLLHLDPTGASVGLPPHQMGTSEVGHLNLGAGRIVDQDLVRVNKAIKDGMFFTNSALQAAVAEAKQPGAALHLLGLCSDGGVHSHINHLYAMLRMAKDEGVEHVFIHALTDGRDTPPRVAKKFLRAIEKRCKTLGIGEIATVSGRYYGMDRDNRWERERQAYDALANDVGPRFKSAEEAVDAAYKRGEGDEFITPSIIETRDHRTSKIINSDSVVFFNFRQDRARQLSHGFTDAHFEKFHRERLRIRFTTFTSYDKSLNLPVAFPPENVKNSLGEWLAKKRIKQFHTAETEKYAHVTYFFNGGREKPFRGEDRTVVPSPKVTTYDLQPEMSAYEIRDGLLKAMRSGLYGFLVVNFANADMVGHTGKLDATVSAVEVLDECLSALETEAETNGYVMLVTADHGNAEDMTGRYQTSHTLNEVPFFVIDPSKRFVVNRSVRQPKLGDVATTVLRVMGVPFAPEMTGDVLVKEK